MGVSGEQKTGPACAHLLAVTSHQSSKLGCRVVGDMS